ncbi:response regulator transcription factor, partial [Flavihumibacter sp. CACIAM 22H1]|uniref:LytR/AlgR family response regulator transcription factor n=1 Tax=Flavihumibacter sp. CACIAM 22H1 TaxID=1812911 RepID=UPI0007A886A5
MTITCLITDDEPLARKGLRGYIEKIDFLQLAGECEDAVSLNNFLATNQVDLLFLDIEMPYISGIEFVQSINHPPKIIFTTAYEKYALKGFDLDALDYLIKPIPFERFLKACNKARDFFELQQKTPLTNDFFIKTEGRYQKLAWNEILVMEALENYIGIHTETGKHLVHMTMKQALEKLPAQFIQVHKSSIVNMDKISGITGNSIQLGKLEVSISRAMKEQVLQKILHN